jgi:hypothetical protein
MVPSSFPNTRFPSHQGLIVALSGAQKIVVSRFEAITTGKRKTLHLSSPGSPLFKLI